MSARPPGDNLAVKAHTAVLHSFAISHYFADSLAVCVQAVVSRLEDKQKLLQQSHILKTAFIVTADDSLPDDLVTTIQVHDAAGSYCHWRFQSACHMS